MGVPAKYIEKRISSAPCSTQNFGPDGLPCECNQSPVWELVHSSGTSFHACEYHIEVLWNVWLPFRSAVRDLWPVKIELSS